MQLSILLPSNREGLTAISRIAQACSWSGPNVEVIVRDNSGNAQKADLISRFGSENCKILSVDPCGAAENAFALLRGARGDFIFYLADDDFVFDHAIKGVLDVIERQGKDQSAVGITGHYAIEELSGSPIVAYSNLGSEDPAVRVAGYLGYGGPNVLYYSALRRDMAERAFSLVRSMPFGFPFHDIILSLLFLMSGKFVSVERLLYCYDRVVRQASGVAEKIDIEFYVAAGCDPIINIIHWLLIGFEGAVLARNGALFPSCQLAQRQAIADLWFSAKFLGFVGNSRSTFGSEYGGDAERIRTKLLASTGQLSFEGLLKDICDVISLFSMDKANKYYEFWISQINQNSP